MPYASLPKSNPSRSFTTFAGVMMHHTPIIFVFKTMGDVAGKR